MAVNHNNCGSASRQFCDELFAACRVAEPNTERHEKTTCGFTVGDSNRFAYLYHKKNSSLATIFLRGGDPTVVPALSNGAAPGLRKKLTSNWAKVFPISIHLPVGSSPDETARMLLDYSLPLAAKKIGGKIGRNLLNDSELRDGKPRSVLLNRFERNRKLRARCIAHYGYECQACGLKLESQYGKIAAEYVHVHHLNPISIAGEQIVDPIKDLRPLCPNCHAVAHLQDPPLSIDDIRRLIEQGRSGFAWQSKLASGTTRLGQCNQSSPTGKNTVARGKALRA